MLDHVSIFSKSGVVLWSQSWTKLKPIDGEDPVCAFVRRVLLEDKGAAAKTITLDESTFKWTLANEIDLVFVVVYHKMLQLDYVEDLLESVKAKFIEKFSAEIKANDCSSFPLPFTDQFTKSYEKALKASKGTARPTSTGSKGKKTKSQKSADADDGKKKGKEGTVWRDGSSNKKISKREAERLDFSKKVTDDDGNEVSTEDLMVKDYQEKYLPDEGEVADWAKEEESLSESEDDDDDDDQSSSTTQKGWFGKTQLGSFLQSMTGNKVLEEDDLEPVLEGMKQQLISKNVASEIADDICTSVRHSLEGEKLASFTRVKTAVIAALKASVLRILTPKKSTDILHEVIANRSTGNPYTIAFVGINGVGKSTSLAKVCYYLKHNGIKVMIAACDTFRSGAVEQLRSHATCLDVPLFEKGYMKDPGAVAKAAVTEARSKGFDCVLIDTAGRMQNNNELMRELAKLIEINTPNQLLFVGEALVGNDGIDQLMMFNKAIAKYLPSGHHEIDGIVLTKFDTIDDKVGATLSMSYKTGQPVMFVGTGQKYTHLKKLNVNEVIRSLFS